MSTVEDIATDITRRYNDEEFSGDELEMVHAAVVEALTHQKVYLVQYNYFADDYSYGHWEETPQVDDGFFLSREEAQAEVDWMNGYDRKYADYVRGVERKNTEIQERHDRALVAYGSLVASGVENPDQYMKKPQLHLNKVETFEEWNANRRRSREGYYDVVEVDIAKKVR